MRRKRFVRIYSLYDRPRNLIKIKTQNTHTATATGTHTGVITR